MKKALNEFSQYKKFISERDRALEVFLHAALTDTSNALHQALNSSLEIISRGYMLIPENGFFSPQSSNAIKYIEHRLDAVFYHAHGVIVARWQKMRRHSFALSASGEFHATHGATKTGALHLTRDKLDAQTYAPIHQGQLINGRVGLALNRLKRKIMDAVETARIRSESVPECITRVKAIFPKAQIFKRPPRALKPFREAALFPNQRELKSESVTRAFIDPDEWEDLIKNYKSDYLPASRFYNEPIDVPIEGDLEEWYAWEIEQELTHDFVDSVRKGQVEGAKAAGIKDFIWIAILDSKTDDCCDWRNGLTTSEIKVKLKSHGEDDEGAIVPPAHFNCRCTIAPVGDIPEGGEELDLGEFSDWLGA